MGGRSGEEAETARDRMGLDAAELVHTLGRATTLDVDAN